MFLVRKDKFPDLDVCLGEKFLGQIVDISLGVDYLFDACIDEYFGTHRTGVGCGVDCCILDTRSEVCGLCHSVLFRVYASAQFMPSARRNIHLLSDAPEFLTVKSASRGSVVTRGYDVFVPYNHSTHSSSETGGSFGYKECHFHEIFIISGSFHAFWIIMLLYMFTSIRER